MLNGYRLGANSYAGKSVDSTEFTEVIGPLGSDWLILDEASLRR